MSCDEELFTTRMRKATRKIHSVSDALINAKFAFSLQDETVWSDGLFVFYHIFAFLEDAKKRLNMPDFDKLFVHKILYRKKSFEEDLCHYKGDNWQSLAKSIALDNYIEHLQNLERENPKLLMAYIYHLYLGLLSGGQILSKKRKIFGENNNGEVKYVDKVTDFTGIDIPQLKKDFRQAMNEIASKLSEDEKQALIEESSQVFLMNNLVVNSIDGQNKVIGHMLYKASAVLVLFSAAILAYKWYK